MSMDNDQTAGTASGRFMPSALTPHAFSPDRLADWGYRPRCTECHGERGDGLHRRPR
jgi:cytochrome c